MSLAGHRAGCALSRSLDAGVGGDLVLVVANGCLGNRANVLGASLQHIRVVRRQDCGRGANNGAESVIELLGLGLVHSLVEGGAGGSFVRGLGDIRVLVEVVVVVGGRAYNRALCMSVDSLTSCREVSTYSLTVDAEVNLRVIRREDAVGGSDNWAGGHDVCCVGLELCLQCECCER